MASTPPPDGRARYEAHQDPDDDRDIAEARADAKAGADVARATLSRRAQRVVALIVVVFAVSTVVNVGASIYLYGQAVDRAVESAEARRLDGVAQAQARRALADAEPAQRKLESEGLFRIPLSGPENSPSFEVIANSASAQVLADMPRAAIVSEDYVALGAAVQRFYMRQPVITQSGPSPLKVQQLCQQYLRVATVLEQRGVLRAP